MSRETELSPWARYLTDALRDHLRSRHASCRAPHHRAEARRYAAMLRRMRR